MSFDLDRWAQDPAIYEEFDHRKMVVSPSNLSRPEHDGLVMWYGATEPKDMKPGDLWHDTSA
jgi:hypothetical protein